MQIIIKTLHRIKNNYNSYQFRTEAKLQEVSSELAQLKALNGALLAEIKFYRQKTLAASAVLATQESDIQALSTAVDSTERQEEQPVITTSSSNSSAMRKRTQYVLNAKL
jgi:hypothetical protein